MKKRRRYKLFFLTGSICLGLSIGAAAQGTFTWRAQLDSIKVDGFYRLILTPELVAKSNLDLGDLRILGPDRRFVSYVLKSSRAIVDTVNSLTLLPGVIMVQKDSSDKHSYIDVEFPEAYTIDWISFVIHDPVFYKRELRILAQGNTGAWRTVGFAGIEPAEKVFSISSTRTRRLRIDIANADNAPLTVSEVKCLQQTQYLLAYLRAGGTYQLFTGNARATAPDYDLKYFTDSIKSTPLRDSIGPLQRIGSQDQPVTITPATIGKETPAAKDNSGLLLWSCLLSVLLFLVYFSVRMVKSIAKKDAHDRL